MNNGEQVLVDSDFWLALFIPGDSNQEAAEKLLNHLSRKETVLITTSLVVGEVATVLSHKLGQKAARDFLGHFEVQTVHITEQLHERALEWFVDTTERGTSYVDCANVAVIEKMGIQYICAFDKVYHKRFGLNNIAYSTTKAA